VSQQASRVEADRLFQEARALLARGQIDEACSKFGESNELLPRSGTLLNLAVCLAQSGRAVAAFPLFEQALEQAVKDGRADREELARTHLEELKAKLAWLSVSVGQAEPLPDLTVQVDGVAWQHLGILQPIEPGSHVVTASAPGHARFESAIAIDPGTSRTVDLPPLALQTEEASVPPQLLPAQPIGLAPKVEVREGLVAEVSPPTARRTLSMTLLGAGVASLAVGGVAGLKAMLDGRALRRICPDLTCPTKASREQGERVKDRARIEALVADVALPIGVTAAGVGLYLWLAGSPNKQLALSSTVLIDISPLASPSSLGASVNGSW